MSLPVPNFIVMGAQKSGTTSLHEYLKAHPDIFMSSPIKEPGYFLGNEAVPIFWERQGLKVSSCDELLEKHMLIGYQGQRLFGDSSTYYTIAHRSRHYRIPGRIAQANPKMKFVYMLRDPIDRIRSNYLHSVNKGRTVGPISEFLNTPGGRSAVLTSMYHFQLEPYLDKFPREQFHFICFEDFVADPESKLREVIDFLGADGVALDVRFKKHNSSNNRADVTQQGYLDFLPEQLKFLKKKLGEDVKKLKSVIGKIPEQWTSLRSA